MSFAPLISRYDGAGLSAGTDWTGVAYIHDRQVCGSGVLLASGLHLLTAAHLVDAFNLENGVAVFETAGGVFAREIMSVAAYPGWLINESGVWHDLALITLKQAAPMAVERYGLYSGSDELNRTVTPVGYGQAQNIYGEELFESQVNRRVGENTIDALGSSLERFGWQGSLDCQLCFDYDDGTAAHDSLGQLLGSSHLGLGGSEAMLTPGDSGGGLFIEQNGDRLLAGINSFVTRYAPADLTEAID
ncbi:MAG: serine protease, partial [Proteobacteria bacterium]|nr:serine protease [Pseudomonadota bacterium]